jgi:guanylate kinase
MTVRLLNFSGPYAVGKDTVINDLLATFPGRLHRVSTLTTRPVDPAADPSYTSVDITEFERLTATGNYLINDQVDGSVKYATDIGEVLQRAVSGVLAIHSIFAGDAGAGALRAALGDQLWSIALVPPGNTVQEELDILSERLARRGRDTASVIESRIAHQRKILDYIASNPQVKTSAGNRLVFDQIVQSGDLEHLKRAMRSVARELIHESLD